MIDAQSSDSADCVLDDQGPLFCLRRNVAAIQVLPAGSADEPKLGMITQLPAGAELAACGPGFNEKTMKVRWAGGMYFVFLQDLQTHFSLQASV